MLLRKEGGAEMTTIAEMESLLSELVAFRGSKSSLGFDRMAIRLAGAGLVREAMGHVRQRDVTLDPELEPLKDKSKYLTDTLVRWLKERGLYESPALVSEPAQGDLSGSPFSILDARSHQKPAVGKDEITTLDFPFSPGLIQWLTFVGPEYFTLTNEKVRADRVESTRIDWKGESHDVAMLRGKLGVDDDERGILTAEHMRILGAVERIWSRQTGPHERLGRRCVVRTNVVEIAEQLCISPGGREYKRIATKLQDLASTGYTYLLRESPALKAQGLSDVNFKFFAEVQALSTVLNGKRLTHFEITFSRPFSAALLTRGKHLVSRPLDMLSIRGDIALKLYVYLYRILSGRGEHSIELGVVKPGGEKTGLLKALGLKTAGWQRFKSQRRREFEKAVREINGRPIGEGGEFAIKIVEGLDSNDFILTAQIAPKDASNLLAPNASKSLPHGNV